MERFNQKRPIKADYVRKYGFEGERIWRFDLLKYEESKQAFDRRQANIKAYQDKIKNEKKALKNYKRTKELYPDVYNAGGETAIRNLTKMHSKQREILKSKPAPKKLFEEFKQARERLGLKSTQKDYQDYLVRIGAKPTAMPAQKKLTAKPKTTAKKIADKPKVKTTAKKSTSKSKAKTKTANKRK